MTYRWLPQHWCASAVERMAVLQQASLRNGAMQAVSEGDHKNKVWETEARSKGICQTSSECVLRINRHHCAMRSNLKNLTGALWPKTGYNASGPRKSSKFVLQGGSSMMSKEMAQLNDERFFPLHLSYGANEIEFLPIRSFPCCIRCPGMSSMCTSFRVNMISKTGQRPCPDIGLGFCGNIGLVHQNTLQPSWIQSFSPAAAVLGFQKHEATSLQSFSRISKRGSQLRRQFSALHNNILISNNSTLFSLNASFSPSGPRLSFHMEAWNEEQFRTQDENPKAAHGDPQPEATRPFMGRMISKESNSKENLKREMEQTFSTEETSSIYLDSSLDPTVIVFDIETTGFLVSGTKILEFACRDLAGGECSTMQTLVNPNQEVPKRSTEVHNITTEMVNQAGVPSWEEVMPVIVNFVEGRRKGHEPVILVAHNGRGFDVPFIMKECYACSMQVPSHWYFVDSLILAREAQKKTTGVVKNCTLSHLYNNVYNLPPIKNVHRAAVDVNMLAYVFACVLRDLEMPAIKLLERAFTVKEIVLKPELIPPKQCPSPISIQPNESSLDLEPSGAGFEHSSGIAKESQGNMYQKSAEEQLGISQGRSGSDQDSSPSWEDQYLMDLSEVPCVKELEDSLGLVLGSSQDDFYAFHPTDVEEVAPKSELQTLTDVPLKQQLSVPGDSAAEYPSEMGLSGIVVSEDVEVLLRTARNQAMEIEGSTCVEEIRTQTLASGSMRNQAGAVQDEELSKTVEGREGLQDGDFLESTKGIEVSSDAGGDESMVQLNMDRTASKRSRRKPRSMSLEKQKDLQNGDSPESSEMTIRPPLHVVGDGILSPMTTGSTLTKKTRGKQRARGNAQTRAVIGPMRRILQTKALQITKKIMVQGD